MVKSDKATILSRVHDVGRLLLAGAEFGDIRQYASEHGWQVSDRQIRRYLEAAYRRLARTTQRDRNQLLGRHLMQRRALYARSVKGNDLRTALQVLRDEAALQGLYPPTKIAPTTPDGKHPYPGGGLPVLNRRQRLVRLLAAEARDDATERRLVKQVTPYRIYRLPDTAMPQQMLYILTMMYVSEQLEAAAMFVNSLFCAAIDDDDPDGVWDLLGNLTAYRFRIGQEAWLQFTQKLGVDASHLAKGNYQGTFLDLYGAQICDLSPAAEELKAMAGNAGRPLENLQAADNLAKSWRRLFAQVCRE